MIGTGTLNLHNIRNNQNYSYRYINYFAFTVRHEEQHRLDLSSSQNWGNNARVPSLDTDGDSLKDSNEATFINGRYYNYALTATYDDDWEYGTDGWDDTEDAALWQQQWSDSDEYDDYDWSNPGRQYGNGYTLP